MKNVYDDKERQEEAIKQSDLDWVIVRPARLTDEPAKGEYRVYLGVLTQPRRYHGRMLRPLCWRS